MSKIRPTTGTDGLALPVLPPERDARVWARLVRVMFVCRVRVGKLLPIVWDFRGRHPKQFQ